MTAESFYAALSDRLRLRAREYEKFDWLAAVPDGKVVYLVGKGKQPKDRGSVKVMVMVGAHAVRRSSGAPSSRAKSKRSSTISSKAAPSPRRRRRQAAPRQSPSQPRAAAGARHQRAAGACRSQPRGGQLRGVLRRIHEPQLQPGHLASARKTLVTACTNNENTRETMITTLRIVQELSPKYDLDGSRAIYDVSGQGLPYERFVLEREDDRWYIAE